jgi:uncharacterized membrane protein
MTEIILSRFFHDRRPVAVRPLAVLVLVLAGVGTFTAAVAVPYVTLDERAAAYGARFPWLLTHIVFGTIALLTGPVQLWLGLSAKTVAALHRTLGRVYVASVAVGAFTSLYLAFHTTHGLVFGAGLAGLAVAWLATTGMAVVAVRELAIYQHREWMIRSYVVTSAFVTFRVLVLALQSAAVGTPAEQIGLASWFCWAVPLLVTECVLQAKKIVS